MKLWRQRLKSLFCRHQMMLVVQWAPEESCVYVVCRDCDKVFGHFHLPLPVESAGETNVRVH